MKRDLSVGPEKTEKHRGREGTARGGGGVDRNSRNSVLATSTQILNHKTTRKKIDISKQLKNDVCFTCSALVSPHGEYYVCKVLVSRHWHVTCVARFISWFKDPFHMCGALGSRQERRITSRTTYITDITCVPRLFRLMTLRTTYISL